MGGGHWLFVFVFIIPAKDFLFSGDFVCKVFNIIESPLFLLLLLLKAKFSSSSDDGNFTAALSSFLDSFCIAFAMKRSGNVKSRLHSFISSDLRTKLLPTQRENELKKLKTLARGGIVTKPAYLPSSGVIVGEHPTYSGGRGLYAGGIPDRRNGPKGMEGVLPFDQHGIEIMKQAVGLPVAKATVGARLNNAAFDKVGLNGQGNVINAQTFNAPTSVSNTTITPKRLPSPNFGGRVGEGDKFLS